MNSDTRPLVLTIDDRDDITRFCERMLGDEYEFRHVTGAREAGGILQREPVAAVLLDRDFSQGDPAQLVGPPDDARNEGLSILRWLRGEHPVMPVLMITGHRDLPTALQVAALKADFLAWEDVFADPGMLGARLRHVVEAGRDPGEAMLSRFRELGIVVASPAFARTLQEIVRAVPGRAPILLRGETGCGKDSLAYAIHALGGDPLRQWVSVNVAALNPNLIESELFGHARGAFTGAAQPGVGKLRHAHGGTLFLNEVGDLSLEVQVKLLTVLERNEVVPVGDVKSYPADFRLITATSRDLNALVASGRFRQDLFHRIAWHTVAIPPLRERREDIAALAQSFLSRTAPFREGRIFSMTREALQYLVSLPWHGNVRELHGAMEAMSAVASQVITIGDACGVIGKRDLLLAPREPEPQGGGPGAAPPDRAACERAVFDGRSYRQVCEAYYRFLMLRSGGRLPEAARLAKISKATIYEWRRKFDLEGDA